MNYEDYARLDGINATALKAGAKSMLHMHHALTGAPRADTPAFRWGRLVHLAVLEPLRLDELQVFDGRRAGKAWDEFCATYDPELIVKRGEWDDLQTISAAVNANSEAYGLIRETEHEVVFAWETPDYGRAKARVDGCNRSLLLEVKTAANIEPKAFAKQCANLGYDIQLGWYSIAAGLQSARVIAIESNPPYDVAVYNVPSWVLERGRDKAVDIAKRYRVHERAGVFPGVSGGVSLVDLDWPTWDSPAAELVGFED